jgi:hypothetical protein
MSGRGDDLHRLVAKDIEIAIHQLDSRLFEVLIEGRSVSVVLKIRAEHRLMLTALDEPSRMTEQPGIADMIEVSMREDDGPDILRRNPDISELITHGPDHDAPDVMGNNPASRFICDRIFDAGIEHDPFTRTVDQIGIAAQCDLITFPFPRCIDGSVRLHGEGAMD